MNNGSGISAKPITASDTDDVTVTRGLYVGVGGNLKADMFDGTTVTFAGLASGMVHPLCVRRVYSTGTTATGIIGVY